MGDFTGFSFGNWHTTDLSTGIVTVVRVSGGDRYEEELHPEIKDRVAEVPGMDGEYYFGSNYGTKTFNIEIAFDSLTETQFRNLRRVFGTKEIKELIFDERPYKKYMAKLESPVEFSYVCFDGPTKTISAARDGIRVLRGTETTIDEEFQEEIIVDTWEREQVYPYELDYSRTERIYKGEGKISLICYFPYAKSVYKQLPEESEEWAISSGILSADIYSQFDSYDSSNGIIKIYNAGDVKTGFRLYCPFSVATNMRLIYTPYLGADTVSLNLKTMTPQVNTTGANDIGFLINTDNELIQGIQSFSHDQNGNAIYTTSGNIYNQYIDSGYLFKLEPNIAYTDEAKIEITNGTYGIIDTNEIEIFYDYLYF